MMDSFLQLVAYSQNDFGPSLKFLLPILIGMALAIGILSNLINYLLEHHQVITMFFSLPV